MYQDVPNRNILIQIADFSCEWDARSAIFYAQRGHPDAIEYLITPFLPFVDALVIGPKLIVTSLLGQGATERAAFVGMGLPPPQEAHISCSISSDE